MTIDLKTTVAVLNRPDIKAHTSLLRDFEGFLRLQFFGTAASLNLLFHLRQWTDKADLARMLEARRPDLLEALLEMGVALGELARDGDKYKVARGRAAVLAEPEGDPLAALIEEYVGYHAAVYRNLPERLRGTPLDTYEGKGCLIARSSRTLEVFMRGFVERMAGAKSTSRLLEIGCGSGIYIRLAAKANPRLTGVGIDIQPDVVAQTNQSMLDWGLAGRFQIAKADIRSLPDSVAGSFDLITLYNNIYYFAEDERPGLLELVRSRLSPAGRLAVVSLFRGNSATCWDFDLVLRSTEGSHALPELDRLSEQLRQAGFKNISTHRLMPIEPLFALVAS